MSDFGDGHLAKMVKYKCNVVDQYKNIEQVKEAILSEGLESCNLILGKYILCITLFFIEFSDVSQSIH